MEHTVRWSQIWCHAVTDDLQHKIGLHCKSWQLCAFSTELAQCTPPAGVLVGQPHDTNIMQLAVLTKSAL